MTAIWKSMIGQWVQKIADLFGPLRTRTYHPERHYMRGPGPKVRAKANARLRQG